MEKIPVSKRCRWDKQDLDKLIGFTKDALTCNKTYLAGYLVLCINTSTTCEKTKELGYCTFENTEKKTRKEIQVKLPV